MAAPKVYTFEVESVYSFPLDMLRYDRAWPRGTSDAAEIEDSLTFGAKRRTRKVTLCSLNAPTFGRWNSFLWFGKEVESR